MSLLGAVGGMQTHPDTKGRATGSSPVRHHPIAVTDNRDISTAPILLRAQIARELLDYAPPWITDRDPPRPDYYQVSCSNDECVWTRYEYWDGNGWPLAGGYTRIEGWMERPSPIASSRSATPLSPAPTGS